MAIDRTATVRLPGDPAWARSSSMKKDAQSWSVMKALLAFSEMLLQWNEDAPCRSKSGPAAAAGYAAANEYFINGQVVLYMSGSWQDRQFNQLIGDSFDWKQFRIPAATRPARYAGRRGSCGAGYDRAS